MSARRFAWLSSRPLGVCPLRSACAALACAGLLSGCNAREVAPPQSDSKSSAVVADVNADKTEYHEFSLTIYGYNYTDTEIGSYEVNGRGGGNLAVSTPTAPGGSSVCCAAIFTPIAPDRTINIKWSRDGKTWCQREVPFQGPVPSNAEYLEVHFYQDGRIEVAATAEPSPPRIKLQRLHGNSRNTDPSKNVINDSKHSRCNLGY